MNGNRMRLVWILTLLGLAAAAGAYDLTFSNMIKNGAVEIANGSYPDKWTYSGSTSWATDASVSPSHSLKIDDASGSTASYWQSIGTDTIAGKQYILDLKWKYTSLSEAFGAKIQWYSGALDGNGSPTGSIISSSVLATGTGTQAAFVSAVEVFTAPTGALSANVQIYSTTTGTGTLWADNIVLRPAPNSLLNADIEYANGSNPDQWTASSANSTWATDRFASGARSLKVVDATTAGYEYWVSTAIPIFEFPTEVSWKWAYENVIGAGMQVQVRWWNGNITSGNAVSGTCIGIQDYYTPTGTNTTFATNAYTLTPPAGTRCADFVVWGYTATSGTIWVDDVSFVQKDPIGLSATATYLPCPKAPRHIKRISAIGVSDGATKIMLHSLTGLVAQTRPEVMLSYNGAGVDPLWLDQMRDYLDTPYYNKNGDWKWYVHNFKDNLINNRYILCTDGTDSLNVATSLSGRFGALICASTNLATTLTQLGLTQFMDVRSGLTEQQVLDTYYREMNDDVAIEANEADIGIRDYAGFASAYSFFLESGTTLRGNVFSTLLPDNSFLMGFWSATNGEQNSVRQSSTAKVAHTVSNGFTNCTIWASMVDKVGTLAQATRFTPTVDATKHYVTISNTGSDNISMVRGWINSSGKWASTYRGTLNFSWAASSALVDVGANMLEYFYRTANTGTYKDYFVCGIGGMGYEYPAKWGDATVMAQMLGNQMAIADMTEVQIIEDDGTWSSIDPKNYAAFTSQAQIKAMMMMKYSDMDGYAGAIRWGNGKPIFGARYQNKPGGPSDEETSAVASAINAATVNVYTGKGYSWVACDELNLAHDLQVLLNASRKLVTADEFFKVMAQAMDVAPWNFLNDEQGWSYEDNLADNDSGVLAAATGGYIYLEGKDTTSDTDVNCSYFKNMPISGTANNITFKVRAESSTKKANLQVRIKDQNGAWTTPQAWTLVSSTTYANKTYSVSAFRNQRITVYLDVDGDLTNTGRLRFDDVNFN